MGATANLRFLTADEVAHVTAAPGEIEDFLFPPEVENPFEGQISLDKAWHAIHYILTGAVGTDGSALGDAVLGGCEIGPSLGYGSARLLSADRVREIAGALAAVDFLGRFDATPGDVPAQIYLGRNLKQEYAYLARHFQHLRQAYITAARDNFALLIYLG
ncbi:YfbM family protein [Tahibacter sp. UC22_41]|uniref:YfbM family protein n=1 Tax=Tahibacter sp. UC22_41 TaxID=3350178 RepID=UPI0036DDE12E